MKKSTIGILICSLATVITCGSLVAAATYALFSDKVKVDNHLQAGSLKATLTRTAHSYSILDEQGKLKETKVESESVSSENITNAFDLPEDALIVPTSKLSASFTISNNDTVAFDYSVSIVLNDENGQQIQSINADENYLAEQIDVTLTGLTGEHKLIDQDLTVLGTETVLVGDSVDFILTLEFIDDDLINNYVQGKECYFDLVVFATQATN